MWHLMEQRIRDTRRGGVEESENVAKECKAVAEEELWSGWNQVRKQFHKINEGDWSKRVTSQIVTVDLTLTCFS